MGGELLDPLSQELLFGPQLGHLVCADCRSTRQQGNRGSRGWASPGQH